MEFIRLSQMPGSHDRNKAVGPFGTVIDMPSSAPLREGNLLTRGGIEPQNLGLPRGRKQYGPMFGRDPLLDRATFSLLRLLLVSVWAEPILDAA